jgi:methylphosphotriester-DNA--protein-cysteine methyltransferase
MMSKKIITGNLLVICSIFFFSLAVAHAQEEEHGQDAVQEQKQTYVGTTLSRKYHYPWCPWAKQAPADGKEIFRSAQEAEEAGYSACDLCNPLIKD